MVIDNIRVAQAGDHMQLHVPWAKADAWHSHFQKLGIRSTLCLDPVAQEAMLDIWDVAEADLASLMPATV